MNNKNMTVEQQLKTLQKLGDPALAQWLALGAGIACALLICISYYQNTFFFAFLAVMITAVAFSCRPTLRHIQQAAKAWRSGRSQEGLVTLSIQEGDETTHYNGAVRLANGKSWTFLFTPPMGWKPEIERPLPVKLYFAGEAEWPALLVHQNGILLPRTAPRLTT